MSDLVHASREALSDGGALASHLDAFVPRPAQLHLTEAIADALQQRDLLLAEVPAPARRSPTWCRCCCPGCAPSSPPALQDQLYHRDLPRVRQALGVGLRSALLKGRSNYLCRYRLQQARGEALPAQNRRAFQRILAWSAGRSATSPNWTVWPMIRRCCRWSPPPSTTVWAPTARSGKTASWRAARRSLMVVVNHPVADLALEAGRLWRVVTGAQPVIDEAHQLPELAAQFFGEGFGMRPWQEPAATAWPKRGVGRSRRCRNRSTLQQALLALRSAMEGLPPRGAVACADDAAGARWLRHGDGRADAGAGLAAARSRGPGCLPCAGA